MSRSFKKHDITGNGGGSEKKDKRYANRRLRRAVKAILGTDPERDIFPVMREVSNIWDFSKDGKGWFGDIPYMNSSRYPHERCFDDPFWRQVYRECKGK